MRIDAREALAGAIEIRNYVFCSILLCSVLIFCLAYWIANSIAQPIERTCHVLDAVAKEIYRKSCKLIVVMS